MELTVFLKGLLIGLFVSLPVGPISVVGIRRILLKGPFHGVMTGFGAATADSIYCLIAAVGLQFIADLLLAYSFQMSLAGGTFLVIFGTRVLFTHARIPLNVQDDTTRESGIKRSFLFAFILAFTNPVMIFSFLAIFAALGIDSISQSPVNVALLVGGVFTGAISFWLGFSQLISHLRTRINLDTLRRLNQISGIILSIFGLSIIISAFFRF